MAQNHLLNMEKLMRTVAGAVAVMLASVSAFAQTGNPYIHDPSTIVECDGKYF